VRAARHTVRFHSDAQRAIEEFRAVR
jgi:hypothetical protein